MHNDLLKLLYDKNINQIEPNIIQHEFYKEKKQYKPKKIKKNIIVQETNITMYQRKFNPRFPPYKLSNNYI